MRRAHRLTWQPGPFACNRQHCSADSGERARYRRDREQLGLSLNAVKTYPQNVTQKLGARNRAQVITNARAVLSPDRHISWRQE
ncbi:LuxR C-terminal-related transcriptional regulator [Amycolatopsis sp. GM8]|uniref:LuxR C-terminal-related transcriptional regulator n=1 Tax=Amycolatopsis sp. GM8 TaxID=2896530 RepID=UPI0027E07B88|nr:LuxR C-terminal-related transcriptional regulator [Amycolatopsis sp. GM8]